MFWHLLLILLSPPSTLYLRVLRDHRDREILALRLARETPHWGYTKIAGEVRKLGFMGLGRSTVARILKRQGFFPPAHRGGLAAPITLACS